MSIFGIFHSIIIFLAVPKKKKKFHPSYQLPSNPSINMLVNFPATTTSATFYSVWWAYRYQKEISRFGKKKIFFTSEICQFAKHRYGGTNAKRSEEWSWGFKNRVLPCNSQTFWRCVILWGWIRSEFWF